jgi:hypothetical protein
MRVTTLETDVLVDESDLETDVLVDASTILR